MRLGKDITVLLPPSEDALSRAVLIDDQVRYHRTQPANGILVSPFLDLKSERQRGLSPDFGLATLAVAGLAGAMVGAVCGPAIAAMAQMRGLQPPVLAVTVGAAAVTGAGAVVVCGTIASSKIVLQEICQYREAITVGWILVQCLLASDVRKVLVRHHGKWASALDPLEYNT